MQGARDGRHEAQARAAVTRLHMCTCDVHVVPWNESHVKQRYVRSEQRGNRHATMVHVRVAFLPRVYGADCCTVRNRAREARPEEIPKFMERESTGCRGWSVVF